MRLTQRLIQAFRNTSYVVWENDAPRRPAFVLRVGVDHPSFRPPDPWVMIGAYTDSTEPTPQNLAAHRRLGAELRKTAKALREGQGFAEDGSGVAERMWLAEGVPLERALALGREFRQLAILVGAAGGGPRLLRSDSGEVISDDVPRPELAAGTLKSVRRRVHLVSQALQRSGFEVTSNSVGLTSRGRRTWNGDVVPEEVWAMSGAFNGAEFSWRTPGTRNGLGGSFRCATVQEMQEDACGEEFGTAFEWLTATRGRFVFGDEDMRGAILLSRDEGYGLAEDLNPLDVINTCLDHLAISGWELALVQFGEQTVGDVGIQLEACQAAARETWRRMGLPLPSSLVLKGSRAPHSP